MATSFLSSPIGILKISSNGKSITEIARVPKKKTSERDDLVRTCEQELREYFVGKRTHFTFPLDPSGTPFQKKVWQRMRAISYGSLVSYGDLAKKIGKPKAVRAVGTSCGKNRILIAIPCHRVITKNGSLGGFSAGIKNKIFLQKIENQL